MLFMWKSKRRIALTVNPWCKLFKRVLKVLKINCKLYTLTLWETSASLGHFNFPSLPCNSHHCDWLCSESCPLWLNNFSFSIFVWISDMYSSLCFQSNIKELYVDSSQNLSLNLTVFFSMFLKKMLTKAAFILSKIQ